MREFDAHHARQIAQQSEKVKLEYDKIIETIQFAAVEGKYEVYIKEDLPEVSIKRLRANGFEVEPCTQIAYQKDGDRFYISWKEKVDCRSAND